MKVTGIVDRILSELVKSAVGDVLLMGHLDDCVDSATNMVMSNWINATSIDKELANFGMNRIGEIVD